MIAITRREHFAAGHRLFNPAWTDAENELVYGKCSNPAGHGHNYVLDVTVAGEVDPATGFLLDLTALKAVIRGEVIDALDHRNLNTDVPWLRDVVPTAENIVIAIWNRLQAKLPAGLLHRIVLQETVNNSVEYRGPQ
jgi:6-pyruvoyltetrahydropterin/6-carboxytetrahydropterin synthase